MPYAHHIIMGVKSIIFIVLGIMQEMDTRDVGNLGGQLRILPIITLSLELQITFINCNCIIQELITCWCYCYSQNQHSKKEVIQNVMMKAPKCHTLYY